jgi:hypothetical protein
MQSNDAYGPYKAFDKDIGSFWCSEVSPTNAFNANTGDYEGQISIFPEEKNTEKIILTRKRHVKIEVQDEKGEKIIYEYKVFCQNHRDSNRTLSAIDFIDEEIKKTYMFFLLGTCGLLVELVAHADAHAAPRRGGSAAAAAVQAAGALACAGSLQAQRHWRGHCRGGGAQVARQGGRRHLAV